MIHKNGFDHFDLTPSDSEQGWETSWEEKSIAVHMAASPPPCLLLVEADEGWRAFLRQVFREEGYALEVASSLDHALAQASAQTFDLILIHLPADHPRQLFDTIKTFSQSAQHTRIGVITNLGISSEEADDQGLAFLVSTPATLEPLLAQIAICLQRPIPGEQADQVTVVEQFLEALTHKEHHKLFSLCTDDLICYSLPSSPVPLAKIIRGKDALEQCMAALRNRYRALRLEVQHIYSRPKGLVAQYMLWWAETDGAWAMKSGFCLLQFSGKRLRQIGLQSEKN
jgi:CheY-like chemotaxis protein